MPTMKAEAGTVANPFLYDAPVGRKQRFLLLSAFVAGKQALRQQQALDRYLAVLYEKAPAGATPFEALQWSWHSGGRPRDFPASVEAARRVPFFRTLIESRCGQYTRLGRFLLEVIKRSTGVPEWPDNCTREDLVQLPGFGLKSASFYLLYTRRGMRMAALDTHILAWLKEQHVRHHIPPATPSGALYLTVEALFIKDAAKRNMDCAELDFSIWKERSQTMKILSTL